MLITQISEVDKKRMMIHTEEGVSFVLYKGEIRRFALQEGEEIASEVYEEIRTDILIKRARKRAMFLLEKMDRTESQLRNKLRQGFYGEDLIDDAIAYVKKYHYIDDNRYAQTYVRYQKERKSKRQIKMDLMQKGVDREIIEQAIEAEYEPESEQELILKWIEKRKYKIGESDIKEKQKMYQFLMRKGFRSEDILHVLE
ncbi:regulatory protein RecX [Roseburia sp. MSJ-14]|uniref:regulatory protein RecX n=1 Tax=Roseburia sp. MSJ-14 TaxID=2841514 RepID=UPI001C0FCBD3|nr:regulatory protein RecX [Roseburia sp. MSJ-14]MBU5472575.1 regulatory protein RecX [Roseburia sp. MSJ-14]